MAFFLDAHGTVERFGVYIEEFRHIFEAHSVPFGSPDAFVTLARNLKSSGHLSADLSILVKSILEKENGKISLRMILTLIAIASGGPHVTEFERDIGRPINLLIDFLISACGCRQIDSEHMADIGTSVLDGLEEESLDEVHPYTETGSAEHETLTDPQYTRAASKPAADTFSTTDFDITSQVNKTLTRLERNAHEVRLYLDSINQRITRIEPRFRNRPSSASRANTPNPRGSNAERFVADRARPYSSADDSPPDTSTIPATASHPYPRLITSRRKFAPLPALLSVATILSCALIYYAVAHRMTHLESHPNSTASQPSVGPPLPATPDISNDSSVPLPPADATAPATDSSTAKPSDLDLPHSSKPLDTKSRNMSQQVNGSASQPAPNPANPPATGSTVTDVPATSPDDARALADVPTSSIPPPPKTVSVSSKVMAANLVSAPRPGYPRLASMARLQGKVILQAIISKTGTVQDLRVINGHRLLRSAAINAVKHWRYRPYYLNGKPVEVATTVSVDFNLHH